MKVTWTTHRDRLAILPPAEHKGRLKELYEQADVKQGGYVTITLENVRKPRTTGYKSQNHAINGYVGQIAKETGEDAGIIKMFCKQLAVRRGYPLMEREGQLIYSRLTGEPLPESEAEISTVEAGYLIDEIVQLAAELGIILEG